MIQKVSSQIPGDVPDLSFRYNGNDLGCVEIGLRDNGSNSTKEMNERIIKNPKVMRNSCWKMVKEYRMDPASIRMIGFIMSGE